MKKIAISKLKADCSAVLERVNKTGEPILVTRFGEPMVQITPVGRTVQNGWLGCMCLRGTIISEIITARDDTDWEVLKS